jgi:hypothetical protein
MNDYGLRPYALFNLVRSKGTFPKNTDLFTDTSVYEEDDYGNIYPVSKYGNSNVGPNSTRAALNWDTW